MAFRLVPPFATAPLEGVPGRKAAQGTSIMTGDLKLPRHVPDWNTGAWERPAPADRAVRSEAVERRISRAAALISDPGLRRLFENTLPNTLDTTIIAGASDERPDTFVLTGDIHAMWLRDSTAQVWPYLSSVA